MESWFWIDEAHHRLLAFMHHPSTVQARLEHPSSARVPQAADRGWSTFRDSQSQIWYFHERQNAWFRTHMYYV